MENYYAVKIRGLPGALALGLLASVIGHAAGYGNAHPMGGAYHGTLLALAFAGVGIFVLAALAVAVASAHVAPDGTVVAARLRRWVPGTGVLALATTGWFAVAEAIEGAHATGPSFIIVFALLAAIVAVRVFALAVISVVSSVAIAIGVPAFALRVYAHGASFERPLSLATAVHSRRLFARPPPEVTHCP